MQLKFFKACFSHGRKENFEDRNCSNLIL